MILTMILLMQATAANSSQMTSAPPSTRATAIEDNGTDARTKIISTPVPNNPRVNARIETRVDSRIGGSTPTPPRPSYTPLYGRAQ